jgi:hypothetical protein
MKLPKLYAPVKIKFWSLRNGLGDGLGVIFDIDTQVTRMVRRVLVCYDKPSRYYGNGDWMWQIINAYEMSEWDYFIETDGLCLDEIGTDLEDIEFV